MNTQKKPQRKRAAITATKDGDLKLSTFGKSIVELRASYFALQDAYNQAVTKGADGVAAQDALEASWTMSAKELDVALSEAKAIYPQDAIALLEVARHDFLLFNADTGGVMSDPGDRLTFNAMDNALSILRRISQ